MVTSFYIRWNLRISNSVNQMWNADMISHFTLIGFCHRILWIKKPILTRTSCFDFVLAVFAGMLAVSLKKQLRVNKIVDWYLFVRKSADQFHTTKHFPFCHWVQHWSENRLVNFYVLCSVLCLRFFCWMIKESFKRFVLQCVLTLNFKQNLKFTFSNANGSHRRVAENNCWNIFVIKLRVRLIVKYPVSQLSSCCYGNWNYRTNTQFIIQITCSFTHLLGKCVICCSRFKIQQHSNGVCVLVQNMLTWSEKPLATNVTERIYIWYICVLISIHLDVSFFQFHTLRKSTPNI